MLESMRILVVEDDKKIASFVVNGLKQSGYAVDHSADGEKRPDHGAVHPYDAAVVDIMLPKLDGLSLIQQLRAKGIRMPVLILSAKASVDDRVQGPAGRRRRLPDQAVRVLRTAGPHPGAHPPRHPSRRADPPRRWAT